VLGEQLVFFRLFQEAIGAATPLLLRANNDEAVLEVAAGVALCMGLELQLLYMREWTLSELDTAIQCTATLQDVVTLVLVEDSADYATLEALLRILGEAAQRAHHPTPHRRVFCAVQCHPHLESGALVGGPAHGGECAEQAWWRIYAEWLSSRLECEGWWEGLDEREVSGVCAELQVVVSRRSRIRCEAHGFFQHLAALIVSRAHPAARKVPTLCLRPRRRQHSDVDRGSPLASPSPSLAPSPPRSPPPSTSSRRVPHLASPRPSECGAASGDAEATVTEGENASKVESAEQIPSSEPDEPASDVITQRQSDSPKLEVPQDESLSTQSKRAANITRMRSRRSDLQICLAPDALDPSLGMTEIMKFTSDQDHGVQAQELCSEITAAVHRRSSDLLMTIRSV